MDPIAEGVCGGGLGFWVIHYDAAANMTTNTRGLRAS